MNSVVKECYEQLSIIDLDGFSKMMNPKKIRSKKIRHMCFNTFRENHSLTSDQARDLILGRIYS